MLSGIWFVTRKYPPSVGGMERLASQLATALEADPGGFTLIAWRGGRAGLPIFFAVAAIRLAWATLTARVRVLYLGDPALAALAWIPRLRGIPVAVTVHGLDITYPSRAYQYYLKRCFWHHLDAYICISRHVAELVAGHEVAPKLIHVLPPGIRIDKEHREPGPRSPNAVLAIVGRLVPRKGVAWLIDQVAPEIFRRHPDAKLIIAGDGPEQPAIAASITAHRLDRNVSLLGRIDEDAKRALLATCDAVLMPNVSIPGDVEGFGLAALEAGAAGKVVFAADLEGLRDAIRNGENGWRLPAGDAQTWIRTLDRALSDRASLVRAGLHARRCVEQYYDWANVGPEYARTVAGLARRDD